MSCDKCEASSKYAEGLLALVEEAYCDPCSTLSLSLLERMGKAIDQRPSQFTDQRQGADSPTGLVGLADQTSEPPPNKVEKQFSPCEPAPGVQSAPATPIPEGWKAALILIARMCQQWKQGQHWEHLMEIGKVANTALAAAPEPPEVVSMAGEPMGDPHPYDVALASSPEGEARIYTKADAEALCEIAVAASKAMTACPKCGLKAKTLLHTFCQRSECPIRGAGSRAIGQWVCHRECCKDATHSNDCPHDLAVCEGRYVHVNVEGTTK